MVDKSYCCSSFLMYRTIVDHSKSFTDCLKPFFYEKKKQPANIHNSTELKVALQETVEKICATKKTALALSGGIDSAILAKFMPKGSIAYTFKCIVPGIKVIDETSQAAKYAEECGLVHKVVEIYWEDFEKNVPVLMKHKGAPIHSIEVQIYKAGIEALKDGNSAIIYGESSDVNYGGMSNLLSKDWTIGEFIDRYSYVKPYHALKDFNLITEPITKYSSDGIVDVHEFNRNVFFTEAMGSYENACKTAGIELSAPYADTRMAIPLNLERVRKGENKYLVREVFSKLYPDFVIPPKTPMPRPMDEWFRNWRGPSRLEFWPNCTRGMSGDQKYYVWVLEKFLAMIDEIDTRNGEYIR